MKVKLMNPLIIRKDKPYFVAENKDNSILILIIISRKSNW